MNIDGRLAFSSNFLKRLDINIGNRFALEDPFCVEKIKHNIVFPALKSNGFILLTLPLQLFY